MERTIQTQEYMFELIEQMYSEDINQKDFCEREGIKYHTLQYWLNLYRRDKGLYKKGTEVKSTPSSVRLIPIEVDSSSTKSCATLTIEYPNGVRLHLDTTSLKQDVISSLTKLISCLD